MKSDVAWQPSLDIAFHFLRCRKFQPRYCRQVDRLSSIPLPAGYCFGAAVQVSRLTYLLTLTYRLTCPLSISASLRLDKRISLLHLHPSLSVIETLAFMCTLLRVIGIWSVPFPLAVFYSSSRLSHALLEDLERGVSSVFSFLSHRHFS